MTAAAPAMFSALEADRAAFVALRHALHAYPELAYQEQRTSDLVARELASYGLDVHRGIGRTGVVGVLRNGTSNHAIGLRADMDALPIVEQNDLAYRSTVDGAMHACGHDGHTAMLLYAARHLSEARAFDGTVVFIFQPAEERGGGARTMIQDGLFERFPADAVFGMHNIPGLPVGQLAVMPGPMMASLCTARRPGWRWPKPGFPRRSLVSSTNDQLILSASIDGPGFHPGASGVARHLIDIRYYRRLLQAAEHGRLDFVLLGDARAVPHDRSYGRLDALAVLSRLAPETSRIGMAISKPTTYSEPFHVSRELATLDFVSGGRAAWNPSTIASDAEAQNFGHATALPPDERRSIGEEFVAVSRKLWDSWEDDTVIADRERGLYIDPHKLHHIDHAGKHFKIRGPQITYRPPQGHVVVIQVDHGDDGEPLSATGADVLVLHNATRDEASAAYARHHAEATAAGRAVRILQRALPILGATEAEAQARAEALDVAAGRNRAADPRAVRLVGSATQVADTLEAWFAAGAADGFHLLPDVLPDGLDAIVALLVPELHRRGLFRSDYEGQTLREHLGLPRPLSQYIGAPSEAHTAYHG